MVFTDSSVRCLASEEFACTGTKMLISARNGTLPGNGNLFGLDVNHHSNARRATPNERCSMCADHRNTIERAVSAVRRDIAGGTGVLPPRWPCCCVHCRQARFRAHAGPRQFHPCPRHCRASVTNAASLHLHGAHWSPVQSIPVTEQNRRLFGPFCAPSRQTIAIYC